MSLQDGLKQIERDLEGYSEESEQVIRDHRLAMACLDFEMLLQKGLQLLARIRFLDQALGRLTQRGELALTPEVEDSLNRLYHAWLHPCEKVLDDLAFFESHFAVTQGDEFRHACAEAEQILYGPPATAPQLSHEDLLRSAKNHPPPQSWFEDSEEPVS